MAKKAKKARAPKRPAIRQVEIEVRAEKEFRGPDDWTPEEMPLFVNQFAVARSGTDAFIDCGVVPIDDLLERKDPARFIVSQRIVTSLKGLESLRALINQLFDSIAEHEDAKKSSQSTQASVS